MKLADEPPINIHSSEAMRLHEAEAISANVKAGLGTVVYVLCIILSFCPKYMTMPNRILFLNVTV